MFESFAWFPKFVPVPCPPFPTLENACSPKVAASRAIRGEDGPNLTTVRRADHLRMRKVRGHLRTRAEGKTKGFTMPTCEEAQGKPGGFVNVCAGILGCKVKRWHYLPDAWSGAEAERACRGPIQRALKVVHGDKTSHRVLEDNDPTGCKSNKALAAKKGLGIIAMEFLKCSLDLNLLDFFLGDAVQRRMDKFLTKPITVDASKKKLRQAAYSIPKAEIRAAISPIRKRAAAIGKAGGGDIARD